MVADKNEILRSAGSALGKYYASLKALRENPTSAAVLQGDELRSADDCAADIEHWKKSGVANGDPIFSYDFNDHPQANSNTVPFSAMRAICEEYQPLYARYRVAFDLLQAEGTLARMREYLKPDDPAITANMIADYERRSNPVTCARSLAAARKLDLMVAYDGVYWRLKGGGRTDDPQKPAKAPLLFHGLAIKDDEYAGFEINTVRRYEFDGNELIGVTEKRYRRPEGADLSDAFK